MALKDIKDLRLQLIQTSTITLLTRQTLSSKQKFYNF